MDPVRVVGAPMDLGADRRGVDMGPSAIRYGGLADAIEDAGLTCSDGGDVAVPRPEGRDPDEGALGGRAKFLDAVATVCGRLEEAVGAARQDERTPLVLGGDHSVAVGSVAGAARDLDDLGVLWFDAHADFNTPATTPSGNVHGMALAAVLGQGPFADEEWARTPAVDPERVAIVGLRSIDESERGELRASPVDTYTMTDIDERGITAVVDEALETVTDGVEAVHVSLDLDWIDPSEAPGVGTPVRGGVSYREAHAAMEHVHAGLDELACLDLVEANPILDRHNRTAELACELAASALGKRVV